MGHSREDKQRSHERIVAIAAARIRESGVDGPGVAEIMQAAGLTHGGFYKHFGSREELVAEAVDVALGESRQALAEVTTGAADPLASFIDWYVSAEHCDDPSSGCAVVSLGADASRADARVRAAYTEQVRRYLDALDELVADVPPTVAVSTLVGAILLARAVDDDALAERIRADVRDAVKSWGASSASPAA
jgi:TetR/AcrR family transcriptional repressor of nem operon